MVRLVFVEPESSPILVRLVLAEPRGFPILDRLVHEQSATARVRRNLNQTNPTYFFNRRVLQKFAQSLDTAANPCLILISIKELYLRLEQRANKKRKQTFDKRTKN